MQAAIAILGAESAATVGEPMEKRKEISGPPANAAPKQLVDQVHTRISALGVEFHEAVAHAGISYTTGYRILKYTASLATVRKLEEWAAKEERRRKRPPQPTAEEQNEELAEWDSLGRALLATDPERFRETLDGLRDVVQARKLEAQGFRKIFRATPEPEG